MKKVKLRWGYTTGTCASAATQAALLKLITGGVHEKVDVSLPGGKSLQIKIERTECLKKSVIATVIKDGGDDPDCTHGAEIQSRVTLVEDAKKEVVLTGGQGVGLITKPGLVLPPGEPAINPVPRQMIRQAINEALVNTGNDALASSVHVEIIVPRGEELSKETLNPRLGIIGGISILGTTGLVKPFSHGAYRATIYTALKVAQASGIKQIFLVTGSTTDKFSRQLNPSVPEVAFCQMGDYVKFSMEWASKLDFVRICVYAFWGKTIKMAQGLGQTHASIGAVDFDLLARMTQNVTNDAKIISSINTANTARLALELLKENGLRSVIREVAVLALKNLKSYTIKNIPVCFNLLDYDGTVLERIEN